MTNKLETLARAGYAARGVVYLLLGGLALTSAFWSGGGTDSTSGALSEMLGLPFGRIILGAVAVGLMGYVVWKMAQGLLNADRVEDDAKGLLTRASHLVSAGANLFLTLTAARLALTGGGGGGENGEEKASAWLLQQPFGAPLLVLAGAAVLCAGLAQIWYGAKRGYRKRLDLPAQHRGWMDRVCQVGLIARGVVLAIVGGFLGYAALTSSPDRAMGVPEALNYVHSLPFGPWLYGAIAAGFVAFGAYGLLEAAFRRVHVPAQPLRFNEVSVT